MKKTIIVITLCSLVTGAFSELELGKTQMDIYGHAMLDMGYQTKQNNPDWYDVVRPSQLPAYENQYGADGNFFMSVRQTRLGFKTYTPYGEDQIKTIFEFELFGTGADAGQTTFRLRHAYGEYKSIGAGQTWSAFMDPDVFPNTVEYWGPSGMIFYRNIQLRYIPLQNDNNYACVTLENPGFGLDGGNTNTVPTEFGVAHYPMPDLAAHYRYKGDWGHVQLAGILRYVDVEGQAANQLDDSFVGWGLNLSGNYKSGDKGTARLQLVYGEAIGYYLNDGPPDVGMKDDGTAETLPLLGIVAFYDHNWSDKYSSSVGYSMYQVDNSSGQWDEAIKAGHYALGNLLYHPTPNMTYGVELQYGSRVNNNDGGTAAGGQTVEDTDDVRVQFSFKYNFGATLLGGS